MTPTDIAPIDSSRAGATPGAGRWPVRVPLVTRPMGILGSLRTARRNILAILPQIATTQPIVSGRTGVRWHMIMDPGAIRHVVLDRLEDYPKSDVTKNLLRPAIGESLFVAEGAHWRWQRRAAAPVFSARNVTALAPYMTRAAEDVTDRIAQAGPRAVNVLDEMTRATFDVISDVTFSGDRGFDRAAVHGAIDSYISAAGKVSLFDMFGMPDWVPRPGRVYTGRALTRMKAVADTSIAARQADGPRKVPDLLDLLMAGSDPETGRKMTRAELRDNLLTFVVAGHETTSLALSWARYLCAFDPGVQEAAAAEARAVLGDRPAEASDVARLPLTRRILDEALRLYPPAALVSRTAQADDTLCGRQVRAGDTVMIPIYALHRNVLLWDDPDAFRPQRFADPKSIDRYAYLPFGDGPRICIGASFALQEAVIILSTLLARLEFRPVAGRDPDPVMIITLRPEGGVWLTAHPRA